MTNSPDVLFPSLAALSTREGVTEYLSTTFALTDPAAFNALGSFLQDPERGIFRGPYVRVRLPFLPVPEDWVNPLGWSPNGFRPYRHQAKAFERLSTLNGTAQPTIVTTGTGSGKTEAFLVPVLDHVRRARERGEAGVKAIILYPMNALVTDQARRIAAMIAADPALAGVTGGVYIGGQGHHSTMGPDHLVDNHSVLQSNPPDILLTNYRMLDLLLLRAADAPIWQASATSLQYVVLDEFHTYDGAQGTDVAMLLRRLGATLGVNTPEQPLGRICPVATSATLGSGTRSTELRAFAETVFGTPFDAASLVGEERHGVEELFGDLDFNLDVPTVDNVLAAPLPTAHDPLSWQPMANVFLGFTPANALELGKALQRHILTRAVANAISAAPLAVDDAVREVAKAGALAWGSAAERNPDQAQEALMRFLALVSVARVPTPDGGVRPLVNLEVQLWVREVSRVLREVTETPRFAWWSDGPSDLDSHWLPAVFCRACGSSGWQALATELGDAFETTPAKIWQSALRDRSRLRAIIPTGEAMPDALLLDPETCAIDDAHGLPVLLTPDEKAAELQRCPACGADDSIRFIGSAVATLVSVSLTQLFGLPSVPEAEKKTLVFTDSVQDAAHRAAFVESRAFAFNFRSALLRAVGEQPASLPAVAQRLAASADDDLYVIAPPDFVRHLGYTGEFLNKDPGRRRHKLLGTRLGFQSHLEVGLRSRVGRTLELTGALGVHVEYDEAAAITLARDIHQNLPILQYTPLSDDAYRYWLQGVFDRLRVRGGILHPWLATFIKDDGKRWSIWGKSPVGMQKFPRGRAAPTFLTTRKSDAFDSIATDSATWLNDWTTRCTGLPAAQAHLLLSGTIEVLANTSGSPLRRQMSSSGASVYGLDSESVILTLGSDADAVEGRMQLACTDCNHVHPTSPQQADSWGGSPCPRMRCSGVLAAAPIRLENFYRRLYRSGTLRRIVAAEHTGLLDRAEREAIETAFKFGASPVDPNVLVCTPTLELGIDIGDLSTVTLSSLPRTPANYLQRVGRAGRSNGNALILATVPTGPRDLYYFAEPLNLINGDVVPPSAYLDATELLHRQFLAYCLDRAAAGQFPANLPGHIPAQLGALFHKVLEEGTWLRAFTDGLSQNSAQLAAGFLDLFGGALNQTTCQHVCDYAADDAVEAIARIATEWSVKRLNCMRRVGELDTAITTMQAQGHLDDVQQLDLRAMRSERRAQLERYDGMGIQDTLIGLSELSLLPNYNLIDDVTTLDVALWWISDDAEDVQRAERTYQRGSRLALTEFAPGASFYARGQKVKVDAVECGPRANPLWTARRLCPSCGWAAEGTAAIVACPRCGDTGVADIGAVHKLLPLREASAEHSRDEALIDDDTENRTRRRYSTVTSVDIDPADVKQAWRLKDQVFGAEYATRAIVRSLNLGTLVEHGAAVQVAGEKVVKSAFRTCVDCGVWWPENKPEDKVRHRGWCPTRKGGDAEWEELVLSHELTTQAVRMLLPVSVFDHTEHLIAMKGALLLGLRADFGGDPQHLSVVTASMSDDHGRPRRFLVLHDTVPGGTGYLDRIGDHKRLRSILTKAREQLAGCPCRSESRNACHRCLLSVLGSREIEYADRRLAVELLDAILGSWEVETIDTVTHIDITDVHLSELESRFRRVLVRWAQNKGESGKLQQFMGPKGKELDLTLPGTEGQNPRWRIKPLVDVKAAGVSTQPDFLAIRQDAQDAPVAIYLDGYEFHASQAHNRTGDDAWKRNALRSQGYRVWSVTWDDVQQFEKVLGTAGKAQFDPLVPQNVQNHVLSEPSLADPDRARLLWGNPMSLLLAYLSAPDADVWEQGALLLVGAVIKAAKSQPSQVDAGNLHHDLLAAAGGSELDPVQASTTVWAAPISSPRGKLPVVVFASKDHSELSLSLFALLDDSPIVVGSLDHRSAWIDWLHWSNVAQFLPLPTYEHPAVMRSASFWTHESIAKFKFQYLPLTQGMVSSAGIIQTLPDEWRVIVGLADSSLEATLRQLASGQSPPPEVGFEVGDGRWQVELCWSNVRLVVVTDDVTEREEWLETEGWRVLHSRSKDLAQSITDELVTTT